MARIDRFGIVDGTTMLVRSDRVRRTVTYDLDRQIGLEHFPDPPEPRKR